MKNKKKKTKAPRTPAEFSGRRARKNAELRSDTQPAMKHLMKVIWPDWQGQEFDEEFARQLDLADEGYYIAKSGDTIITPEDALELYNYHNYMGNRRFSQQNANHLANVMKLSTNISIAIGPDRHPDIMNGQHTLWAIHMKGRPIQAGVMIYMVKDEKAKIKLFSIFDTPQKRSLNNALHAAEATGFLEIGDISISKLARWSRCIASAQNDFKQINESLIEKANLAEKEETIRFAQWMENFVKDSITSRLAKRGVVSAFYAMWISDRKNAEQFVEGYFTGVGLDKNSPILKIREAMMTRPKAEHASTACRTHSEMVYTAWRKFCLDEPLLSMRRTLSLPYYKKWKIYFAPERAEAAAIKIDTFSC